MADYSPDERAAMAKKGQALPDGSFPIANEADLRNAIQAFGRAKDKAAAKAHIRKRATALGLTSLLPDTFSEAVDLQSLNFADASDPEGDGVSAPFEVLRVGKTNHPSFGKTDITEADLDRAVENFKSQAAGPELPVDWEHSFAEGGESRAAGWITNLFRKGKALFAQVRWTDKAREDIRSEQYRYISAEFNEDWKDETGAERGFTLLAAGLTNRPFLKGMTPVALSERIPAEEVRYLVPALESKPNAPTETPSEVADEKTTTPEKPEEKDAETVTLSAADHRDLVEKANAFDEAEQDKQAEADKAKSFKDEVRTLSERVKTLESDLLAERVKADLGQARREGRIDAADETTQKWTERYEKLGTEVAHELLFELPAETIPMTERGHGKDKSLAEDAPEGTDQEAYELDLKVKDYMAEHDGVSYTEALDKVTAKAAS